MATKSNFLMRLVIFIYATEVSKYNSLKNKRFHNNTSIIAYYFIFYLFKRRVYVVTKFRIKNYF